MKQQIMNIVTLALATLIIVFTFGNTQAEGFYGKINVDAVNAGNLQIKGVTWCKKYFDVCVINEKWTGPILNSRDIISPSQFVIIQTGISDPQIVGEDDLGDGKYRIIFVYDQNKKHEPWIPEYNR